MQISFKGPFHYNQINSQINSLQHNKDVVEHNKNVEAGVYIWGFMYRLSADETLNLINLSEKVTLNLIIYEQESISILEDARNLETKNLLFVPYYVGIDSQIQKFTRIKEHHNPHGNRRKYTRFSMSFLSEYFKGQHKLPIHYIGETPRYHHNIIKFAKKNLGCIKYFNECSVLTCLYPKEKLNLTGRKGEWPIEDQLHSSQNIDDTLETAIDKYNNFWFCYAQIPTSEGESNGVKRSLMEDAEALTYWSLKGVTISKIKKVPSPSFSICYTPIYNDIFKRDANNNVFTQIPLKAPQTATESMFPGYIKD